MSKTRGSKENPAHDSSFTMPTEQRANESNKQKILRVHDVFPLASKDHIAKILQYYDDDENRVIDALTRDGGEEALSNWAECSNLKSKNKSKKKKKKAKKDSNSALSATASFDADDSSSLHSGGNVEADIEKDGQKAEIENGMLPDVTNDVTSIENLDNHERLTCSNAEPEDIAPAKVSSHKVELEFSQDKHPISSVEHAVSVENTSNCDKFVDSPGPSSPLSDTSEKQGEHGVKREKFRSITDGPTRHMQRQRTTSNRRSKSSSISEESSSQNNPQSVTAVPTKRGYDKCKKDLNRQTVSLQRIQNQLERGFEESERKVKTVFLDIVKQIENRHKEVVMFMEKRKKEAFELLKSRQDLAVELKRRVDRTPSLTEPEWTELRSDVKQFVTERKYDDDLGKTIWFQWTDISEVINSYGEVQPVKNVYSQRSQSALGSSGISNNAVPSPSSSLVNEENESAVDKNDASDILDAAEEAPLPRREEHPSFSKVQPVENRPTREFFNKSYDHRYQGRLNENRGAGYNRGSRGGGGYQRQNYRGNHGYNKFGSFHNEHRGIPDRDPRVSGGPILYHGDRNMNMYPRDPKMGRNMNMYPRDPKMGRSHGRGGPNMRYNRNMGPPPPRYNIEHSPAEPLINAKPDKCVVNGYVNNSNNNSESNN